MRIEIDEKELVEIIRVWVSANLGVSLTNGKDIRISSKSYQALAAVVTIEKPVDESKKEA